MLLRVCSVIDHKWRQTLVWYHESATLAIIAHLSLYHIWRLWSVTKQMHSNINLSTVYNKETKNNVKDVIYTSVLQ